MDKRGRLGVLCPTRMRHNRFLEMLESYEKHSVDSNIYFAFELLDKENIYKYMETVKKKYPDNYWLVGNIGFANKVNILCEEFPEHDAYMVLNDDQIIHTPNWDKILMDKLDELKKEHGHSIWIFSWRDGINDDKLTPSFATQDFIKVLGGYYPHRYMKHLYTDNMYHWIGEELEKRTGQKIIVHLPEIFIEHLHFCKDQKWMDDNYKQSNNIGAYKRDAQLFDFWKNQEGERVVSELEKLIKQNK